MPQSADRRATPRRRTADPRSGAAGPRRRPAMPRYRGEDAARNGPAVRRDGRLTSRRDDQAAELDRALTAALAVPAPAPTTFRELGLAARLVDALAASGIDMPFAIQARALPDALAGPRRPRPCPDRVGQDARLRPAAADQARRPPGPPARQGPPRAGPGPDPGTRPAGRRGARAARPPHRREHHDGLRRRADRQADRQSGALRRRRGGHPRPAHRPDGTARLHARPVSRSPSSTRPTTWPTWASCPRSPGSWTRPRRTASGCSSPPPWTAASASWCLLLSDPALHAVDRRDWTPGPPSTGCWCCPQQDKVPVAAEIAGRPGRTLFFVRTKHGADRLAKQFPGGRRGRGHPRRPEPEPAAAGPGRVHRRASSRPGRHRRRGPRHPRGRRRPRGAVRPAERPQGLPAPLRPHGPGRRHRHGRRAGGARPGPRAPEAARRRRGDRGQRRGRRPGITWSARSRPRARRRAVATSRARQAGLPSRPAQPAVRAGL
jgi:hypothetical protein